ncbi:hypothetical protein [Laribacter hongkongensis]|uniref:hypothetical protein n=1 Tax=Laribacter hongkongensis TaxID=168471 RepID=UPI001EFD6DC4|nr:hypothetical protein [Laribacter hongkongensis]MCG9033129.1 hypothetical protein [Laribacter hongkongensis]MCG9093213.1 hypothetical protein [Laribacter hongkongensis]
MHLVLFFDGGRVLITIRGIPLTQDGRTLSKAVRMAEAYAKTVCRDLDAVMNSSDEEIADKLYSAGTEEVCSHDIEAIRDDAIAAVSDALDYLTRAKRVLMVIDHIGDPRAQPVLQSQIVMPSVTTGKSSCRATRTRRASKAASKSASGDTGDPDPEPRRRLPKSRLARLSIAAVWRFLRPDNPRIQQTVNCIPDHADACASESLIAVCLEHAA